ncbi:Uncharacterised protein r2_g2747 [Pycnogonum litorale]
MPDDAHPRELKHFTSSIPPPSKMNIEGNLAVNWRRFIRQFNNYMIASRLNKEDDAEYKMAIFLATIGEDAHDLFDGLKFYNDEHKKDINKVIEKFHEFFIGETHEAYEAYKFHSRKQECEETIEGYVGALRKLAQSCNFGQILDRLIRDQVVIGVKDEALREKLLGIKDLTLDKCLQTGRAYESSRMQLKSMQSTPDEILVQQIRRKGAEGKSRKIHQNIRIMTKANVVDVAKKSTRSKTAQQRMQNAGSATKKGIMQQCVAQRQ